MARISPKAAAAALALLLPAAPALAACPVPQAVPSPGVQFPANIQPSDGVLDAWCRLQNSLQKGTYQIKLVFFAEKRGLTGKAFRAERTFEATFDPANPRGREVLAGMIQSLIPTDSAFGSKDPDGQPFPAALERTVQGAAAETPDGQGLGVPRRYAPSAALALWMPLQIKIRPIRAYDRDFYLALTFRPSVGRFLMATTGQAEQLILKAATNKVMPYKDFMSCTEYVPDCKSFKGETVDLQTAWSLESVGMAAEGANLSATTKRVISEVAAANLALDRTSVHLNTLASFSAPDGSAELQVKGPTRELTVKAEGDPRKAAGTQELRLIWTERDGVDGTYAERMKQWTRKVRDDMVLSMGQASGASR